MKTQTIVYPNKNPQRYFGVDFFACPFTGSHASRKHYATTADIDQTFRNEPIMVKTNFTDQYDQELTSAKPGAIIGFYQNPDPYNLKIKDQTMSQALQMLLDRKLGIYIETSSELILKDIGLLKEIQLKAPVIIAVPVGFANDVIQAIIQPEEPSLSHKLKIIQKLSQESIQVGVILKPIIPYINDSETNIAEIIEKVRLAGAKFIYPSFGIILADTQRRAFMELISKELPGLRNIFMDGFGLKKSWSSPCQKQLKKAFVFNVKKQKLLFGMNDIVAASKPAQDVQMKLF